MPVTVLAGSTKAVMAARGQWPHPINTLPALPTAPNATAPILWAERTKPHHAKVAIQKHLTRINHGMAQPQAAPITSLPTQKMQTSATFAIKTGTTLILSRLPRPAPERLRAVSTVPCVMATVPTAPNGQILRVHSSIEIPLLSVQAAPSAMA